MTEYNKNFDWENWSKKFDSAVAANSSIDSLLIMSCIETEELTEAEGYKDLYKIQPADK